MIALVPIILLLFSVVWFLVWFWFFKPEKTKIENYYKLALMAFESGDYKKAKELFLKMPNLHSNVDAKYKLGVSYLKLKDFENAQSCLDYVVKKSPKNIEAMKCLALVMEMQEKYDEALGLYDKLSKIDSKDLKNFICISKIYSKKGDELKSLEGLEKERNKFSNDSEYLLAIINCKSRLCDKQNPEECKSILRQYKDIEKRGDLPHEFYISIARAYAINGEIDNALVHCQKAVEIGSEDVEAYQLLGIIQFLKKDIDSAKANLTIALNCQPNNKETHEIFSYVLCQSVDSCTLTKCRENYYKLVSKYINN